MCSLPAQSCSLCSSVDEISLGLNTDMEELIDGSLRLRQVDDISIGIVSEGSVPRGDFISPTNS
jgi:hypothetical protein